MTATGTPLPVEYCHALLMFEHGETRSGDRHVRIGDGYGSRADVALAHRLIRTRFTVRRYPAGIDARRWNRMRRGKTRYGRYQRPVSASDVIRCKRSPRLLTRPSHRMRTQVNNPPIQAARGRAAMIATISSHSAIIRTNGVNLVIGTSSAASKPAPPNPARTSAPHSTASAEPQIRAQRI